MIFRLKNYLIPLLRHTNFPRESSNKTLHKNSFGKPLIQIPSRNGDCIGLLQSQSWTLNLKTKSSLSKLNGQTISYQWLASSCNFLIKCKHLISMTKYSSDLRVQEHKYKIKIKDLTDLTESWAVCLTLLSIWSVQIKDGFHTCKRTLRCFFLSLSNKSLVKTE